MDMEAPGLADHLVEPQQLRLKTLINEIMEEFRPLIAQRNDIFFHLKLFDNWKDIEQNQNLLISPNQEHDDIQRSLIQWFNVHENFTNQRFAFYDGQQYRAETTSLMFWSLVEFWKRLQISSILSLIVHCLLLEYPEQVLREINGVRKRQTLNIGATLEDQSLLSADDDRKPRKRQFHDFRERKPCKANHYQRYPHTSYSLVAKRYLGNFLIPDANASRKLRTQCDNRYEVNLRKIT